MESGPHFSLIQKGDVEHSTWDPWNDNPAQYSLHCCHSFPKEKGDEFENGRVAFPEIVPIQLKTHDLKLGRDRLSFKQRGSHKKCFLLFKWQKNMEM